jgi:hypothetical protein
MSKRTKKKTNMREVALKNLQKANEAKKAKRSQLNSEDWETRSRARLESIIEKTEKLLTREKTLEGADPAKLTNALKVCHQAYRSLKEEDDSFKIHVRTPAEAQAETDNTLAALGQMFRKLPPASKLQMWDALTQWSQYVIPKCKECGKTPL